MDNSPFLFISELASGAWQGRAAREGKVRVGNGALVDTAANCLWFYFLCPSQYFRCQDWQDLRRELTKGARDFRFLKQAKNHCTKTSKNRLEINSLSKSSIKPTIM